MQIGSSRRIESANRDKTYQYTAVRATELCSRFFAGRSSARVLLEDIGLSMALCNLRNCLYEVPSAPPPAAPSPLGALQDDTTLLEDTAALEDDLADPAASDWLVGSEPDLLTPNDDEAGPGTGGVFSTKLATGQVPPPSGSLVQYLREVRAYPTLSAAEEKPLALRAQAGDRQAAATLMSANLSLVVAVARSFMKSGLPLEDLIGDGNMGLIEAVNRFDPDRGVRFATYARFWIKQSIRQGILDHSRTVRLPVHVIRDITKLSRAQRHQSNATTDEGGAPLERLANATGKTVGEVSRLMLQTQLPLSMDMPVAGEESTHLADAVEDQEGGTPESKLVSDQTLDTLLGSIDRLSKVERVVVLQRYGFATGEPATLEDVGSLLGLTAERVRQIQKAALPKLQAELLRQGLDASTLLS